MKLKDKKRVVRFRKAYPEKCVGKSNVEILITVKFIADGRKKVNRLLSKMGA